MRILLNLAVIYLTKKFLTQNKMNDALVRYENYLSDRKLFKTWLGGLKKELSELYKQEISKAMF